MLLQPRINDLAAPQLPNQEKLLVDLFSNSAIIRGICFSNKNSRNMQAF
jgi:hypothetical protein